MQRGKEVPGNTLASQLAFDKAMVTNGIKLGRIEQYITTYAEDEIYIQGMSIRVPQDIGEDYFVVVRASTVDGSKVAFHNAAEFGDLIIGLANRMQNKSLKWKDDKYAK